MDRLATLLAENRAKIATDTTAQVVMLNLPSFRSVAASNIEYQTQHIVDGLVDSLQADTNAYQQVCGEIGRQQAERGYSLNDLWEWFRVGFDTIVATMQRELADDPQALADALIRMIGTMNNGRQAMLNSFLGAREMVIDTQQRALREIRTPIVPIRRNILVLPIVGLVDSQRATQITEAALEQITVQQADVLIIDITGVPIVDTGVANYLVQTARAVRLLGAEVLLVGISAAIAQSIVSLGIDLEGIIPRANLQSAIEYALAQQGLSIQPIAGR